MNIYPPEIRNYLHFSSFSRHKSSGDWRLILSPYYAQLFTVQEAKIYAKSIGWRDSTNSSQQYTYFKQLEDGEIRDIDNFIDDYKRYMIVGVTEWISSHFSNELDACLALDKTFKTLTERTPIGEHFYQAKYQNSKEDFIKLADHLLDAIYCADRFRTSEQAYLSYIPFGPNKVSDLPKSLVEYLSKQFEDDFFGSNEHILDSSLKVNKPAMKNSSLEQKFDFWSKLVDNDAIAISQRVVGKTVFIVDDLYQSGVTLWSYARFLKSKGADKVISIACVKAAKDTDNTTNDNDND